MKKKKSRPESSPKLRRMCLGVVVIVCGVLGCREEEIKRYQIPREEVADQGVRFLGVIVPHEDRTWFFKLVGSAAAVEAHRQEFEQFLETVRFSGKAESPLTWTAPEGWEVEGKSKMRLATFRMGPKGKGGAELSVTPLGREAGSVLDNVNRWRGQIGLPPIRQEELGRLVKLVKVAGENAVLVDMKSGHGAGRDGRSGDGIGTAPLSYRVPRGWREQPVKPGSMRVAGFVISEGDQSAEVTVIAAGGSLRDNINRWREQLQLAPVREEEMPLRKIEVGGMEASYVELMGPESAGVKREGILGVVVNQGAQSWFIKLKGPAELVARQKSNFEEFIRSVRFEKGAIHG